MAQTLPTKDAYREYTSKMQQIADVRNAIAVLGWDQETYLPDKGAAFRGAADHHSQHHCT